MTNELCISTEPISTSLLEEAASLYLAEAFKTAVWHWQFKPRFGETPRAIIARMNGKMIGFNATMPIQLVAEDSRIIKAIWSCDFIVDPAYRGMGIGSKIKDEMLRSFHEPIMSLGISDSAFPILLKKGWLSPEHLSVLQLLRKPTSKRQKLFQLLGLATKTAGFLCRIFDRRTIKCETLATVPAPEQIEYLWQRHRALNGGVEIFRSHEYLHWRYQEFPFNAYKYLATYEGDGQLQSFLVYRLTKDNYVEVTDYIGDFGDFYNVSVALGFLCKKFPDAIAINWNASSKDLQKSLLLNGFIKKRYSTRFVAKGNDIAFPENTRWVLSSGDSDGDFLRTAKDLYEEPTVSPATSGPVLGEPIYKIDHHYAIHLLNETDFSLAAQAWQKLLLKSSANRLFMSWEWMSCWWKTWSKTLGLSLRIYCIYKDQELVAVLPLYCYKKQFLTWYQFLGNAWGVSPTVRSEYISPIIAKAEFSVLEPAITKFLKNLGMFTVVLIPDSTNSNPFRFQHLIKKVDLGYYIDTRGDLDVYQESLGRMTRLKAFNRKDYMHAIYSDVEFTMVPIDQESLESFFDHLNAFHVIRWGKPCFDPKAVAFHKALLSSKLTCVPHLSYIKVGDRIVSVSYNILVDGRLYNVQSGYLEDFDKKISLGTLHMGWILESCFASPEIYEFDFLAGAGKTENYKRHYKGVSVSFYTLQYFPSSFVFWLFKTAKTLKKLFLDVRSS